MSESGKIFVLDEANPSAIPEDVDTLFIENIAGGQVDEKELATRVSGAAAKRIKRLRIAWSSKLTYLGPLLTLTSLERLEIVSNKITALDGVEKLPKLKVVYAVPNKGGISDVAAIKESTVEQLILRAARRLDISSLCPSKSLQYLSISGWKYHSMDQLSSVMVPTLAMTGGALEFVGRQTQPGRLEQRFSKCSKLTSIFGIDCHRLEIDACNRLDLKSISSVRHLKRLWLISPRQQDLVSFLPSCTQLENFSVTGNAKAVTDVRQLIEHPALKRVFIPMDDELVRRVGIANPILDISNDRVFYHKGREVTPELFYNNER
jgi:hypothetical protein